MPIFKIDCSDQTKKDVDEWLIGQKESKQYCYTDGLGETLLLDKGEIIDFIKNPGQLGFDQTQEKIKEW
ncbi:MAG: hypothetical protein JKX76_03435 [Colwellia sp.]|nr:hypothetical protein [Colwellia sp.]